MGRDRAESTTTKTAAMQTDGELDHFIGRNPFPLVFGMRQSGVGKVERVVKFILCERLIGGIDHSKASIHFLKDALGGILVRFFLDMSEILSLCFFVVETLFVTVQENVVRTDTPRDFLLLQ